MGRKKSNRYRLDSWSDFTQKTDLATWQRFMDIIGENPKLPSKTQCIKAMRHVHINIRDLIDATREGRPVPRFPSRRALAEYTARHRKYVCIDEIRDGQSNGISSRKVLMRTLTQIGIPLWMVDMVSE